MEYGGVQRAEVTEWGGLKYRCKTFAVLASRINILGIEVFLYGLSAIWRQVRIGRSVAERDQLYGTYRRFSMALSNFQEASNQEAIIEARANV